MNPLPISHFTATSALGRGVAAHWQALRHEAGGLAATPYEDCALSCWIGEVKGLERPLEGPLAAWDCRNNRLAALGLAQDGFAAAVAALKARRGAARIGVFIGTSTSGVRQTERAYAARTPDAPLPAWFDYHRTHNTGSIAAFVRLALGLEGPAMAISTACSSSAKVFASAHRAIETGLCDAAVVGGVDSLCLTTLHGFNSLQLVSPRPCRPADATRDGISIGEAAGFAIVEPGAVSRFALLGYGESSDAHHMSTPEPSGRGAVDAMRAALARAGLEPRDIDYLNLHGTGTQANDLAEDRGVCTTFGDAIPCSSTKGWTGHTLGAAGILEAVIALICCEQGFVPRSLNTVEKDPRIGASVQLASRSAAVRRVMSNSFGFGGSNCALVLGAVS
ncbi:MAG TPA: beta-ketoacyl-[acyl-carrier-protein] synthase family protein [Nevskiaceae bacterium]|nr:beta-ketoacyl-[acyl-carrier-protein] synthase family protein [Nevskiaceae bacterium]